MSRRRPGQVKEELLPTIRLASHTWGWPKAGVAPPNKLPVVLPKVSAPADWVVLPKAGCDEPPNRLGVLLGVPKLPPNRLGVLGAPKAGVLLLPNKLGVLAPPKATLLAPPGVELDEAPKEKDMIAIVTVQLCPHSSSRATLDEIESCCLH